MPEYRFSASVGASRGELRITAEGIEFIPSGVERNGQLMMDLRGWAMTWDDVADIERVGAGRVQSRTGRSGALRVHYDGYLRFITVEVHEQLEPVFDAVDQLTQAA